jgi:serine/threonine protein kinase
MHSNNIIHRDIKLENILVKKINDKEYVLKICDFGHLINLTARNSIINGFLIIIYFINLFVVLIYLFLSSIGSRDFFLSYAR